MASPKQLERLAAAGIELLPLLEFPSHFVFHREGFAALVERTAEGFGHAGSAGLLIGRGLAVLVWRAGRPSFQLKEFERPASDEEVAALRSFARDLEQALGC